MNNVILYFLFGAGIYLFATRLLHYFVLLFLNKEQNQLDSKGNKIKEEIRDLSKQLEDNKRPVVPDLTPDQVKKHWNPDSE